jgi:CheY-like chemotaxis protein
LTAADKAGARARREPSDLRGVRILVVEDYDDVRQLLVLALELRGAEVRGVSGARDALDLFGRETVDVLVSDIAMPGEDGFWLIRQVRERFPNRPLTAIAVTGQAEEAHTLRAGFTGYIRKPVDPDVLAGMIRMLLG